MKLLGGQLTKERVLVWLFLCNYSTLFTFALVTIVSFFLLINWCVLMILAWPLGKFLSLSGMLATYYYGMRNLVRILAFPGISQLFRRNMEYTYNKSMCQEVFRSVVDFKTCLEMFSINQPGSGALADRTDLLQTGNFKLVNQALFYSLCKDSAHDTIP
jgi:hypothetical protein